MSGALALLNAVTGWQVFVRPASFRGVPFLTDVTEGQGGRRKVVHEFPGRDDPYIEDLGRKAQRHKLTAFVIGDDYMDQRDDLISACQDYDDAATLVHPYLGELQCHAGVIGYRESQEYGGSAVFDLEFIVDTGGQASPLGGADTASALLTGIVSLLQVVSSAYTQISLIVQDPAYLLTFAGGLLGSAADAFLGLPAATTSLLGNLAAAIAATPLDTNATAAAVTAAFSACVDGAVAAQTPAPAVDDPVLGITPILAPPTDPSGGLAALCIWGSTLAAPPGVGAVQAAQAQQQAAIVALIQGNAVAAVMQVYAQVDWPTADAADAARTQLLGLLDAQALAAADAGQDALYSAWLAVTGLAVQDMIQRVQGLPTLGSYATPMVLPALALAQLLYQDASRAGELVAMNDVPHPLFMPVGGLRLSA